MPTSKFERVLVKEDVEYYLQKIQNGELFGFIECDVEVPKSLRNYFSELPPIFKNSTISFEDIGQHMQKWCFDHSTNPKKTRKLVGSMWGKKILLYTPLLQWYLDHGLQVTKIYQIIKYTPKRCFKKFADEVSEGRRAGDQDKDKQIIAQTMKLLGNCAYGFTVTDKEKYCSVKYVGDDKVSRQINDRFFKDLNELNNDMYEVIKTKSKVTLNLPLQIGSAVYQLAKLRMLQFKYDFIDRFIDQSD